jgi:hypothetical protein
MAFLAMVTPWLDCKVRLVRTCVRGEQEIRGIWRWRRAEKEVVVY